MVQINQKQEQKYEYKIKQKKRIKIGSKSQINYENQNIKLNKQSHLLIQQKLNVLISQISIPSFFICLEVKLNISEHKSKNILLSYMSNLVFPTANALITTKIQPKLMKDSYKKVHIYLFDFEIVLGKGSFSKVYKGINLNTNQQVAVKVIEMGSINTPKLRQLLLQQIDILMKVKHENLIKCFQVLSSSKNTYIIMELCTYDFGSVCDFMIKQKQKQKTEFLERQNHKLLHNFQQKQEAPYQSNKSTKCATNEGRLKIFNQNIQEEPLKKSIESISSTKSVEFQQQQCEYHKLNLSQNLRQQKFYPYIKQIFLGLEYLSRQNIVHRDLKLSNIFLTNEKACKIGDFGFAAVIPQTQSEIRDSCCIGSPLYMSPESYIQNVYSLKSDVWSFGILIFQMIYGNPPHWNCPTHEILKSEIKKPINLNKFEKLEKISSEMTQVLEGCLQVQARRRLSISQLKQTKLFKRIFYQPIQSTVINYSSRNKSNIQQSSVQILGRPHSQDKSFKVNDQNSLCQYQNFSTIQKVYDDYRGLQMLNLVNQTGNINNLGENGFQNRKTEKTQTLKHNNSCMALTQQEFHNNSFTDRGKNNQLENNKQRNPSRFKNNATSNQISVNYRINSNQQRMPEGIQSHNNQIQLPQPTFSIIKQQTYDKNIDLKFKSTDLNGNIFKQISKMNQSNKNDNAQSINQVKQQFLYRNSEGLQKYLKEIRQSQHNGEKQYKSKQKQQKVYLNDNRLMNLKEQTNLMKNNQSSFKYTQQVDLEEKQSPKFASTFSGPFYNAHSNLKKKQSMQNFSMINQNYQSIQNNNSAKNDLFLKNYSMLQKGSNNTQKISTSYSPRSNLKSHNFSQSYKYKQSKENNKQNNKQNNKDTLLTKNYSTGNFNTETKSYFDTDGDRKYQYKKKILQKCTSSPKFQTNHNNDFFYKNDTKIQAQKTTRYMTTSNFIGNSAYLSSKNHEKQSIIKDTKQSALNIIKQFNLKEQSTKTSKKPDLFMKTFDSSNNFLTQFSCKMKEQPSHIQKKTYWKTGNKHFNNNICEKGQNNKLNTQNNDKDHFISSEFNTPRNTSFLYATSTQKQQLFNLSEKNKKINFGINQEKQHLSIGNQSPFKLLSGQIIIKQVCELIHFSRLLHKLSFTTDNNPNSIALLQYSIQILSNLLQKCQNFEVKYHYQSSTSKSAEIRESFKSNQAFLNSLSSVNQKQCYTIKKDLLYSCKDNSSACNKTIQLKTIIQSYIKKYSQRKEALIKLFQCNALFQNLTNKVKQAKNSSKNTNNKNFLSEEKFKRRGSITSQKGYLNFMKLQKTLEQMNSELLSKKDMNQKIKCQKQLNNIFHAHFLLHLSQKYIQSIVKCIKQRSFINLIQYVRLSLKKNKNNFQICKQLSTELELEQNNSSIKSMIEKILDEVSSFEKNYDKTNTENYDSLANRNFSMMVGLK